MESDFKTSSPKSPLEMIVTTIYHQFKKEDLAKEVLHAFAENCVRFEEYNEVAKLFFDIRDLKNSSKYAEKALKLSSSYDHTIVTTKNLINVYNQNNEPEKALSKINILEKENQDDYDLLLEKSFTHSCLGEFDIQAKILFDLYEKKEELSLVTRNKVYHNLCSYYFRNDNLNKGLEHFIPMGEKESYKKISELKCKKWDGSIEKDRIIYIDAQCGAGDEIMNIRFMKNIEELGMKPVWLTVRKDLEKIFKFNGYNVSKIVNDEERKKILKEGSSWVYALATPYYLNLSVHDLGREPYLKPLPEKEEQYSYLKEDKKYKIGVFWNSGSGYQQANFRVVDDKPLFNCLSKTNSSLYSLHTHFDAPIPEQYQNIVKEFKIPDRDFTDTFSIISHMDLVVTSCTSIAHIAASIGKEVCVLVPTLGFYAWASTTGKSWWYGDHVHIFKQTKARSWDEPISKLEKFLSDKGI